MPEGMLSGMMNKADIWSSELFVSTGSHAANGGQRRMQMKCC